MSQVPRRTFNVVHEPWIPCVYDGETLTQEVGLREALVHAHRIAELTDPSPLVTAALHRLLLAVLHRVFGPGSLEDWSRLYRAGSFDTESIEQYLKRWLHRFDLFDHRFPFYQTPKLPGNLATSVAKLGYEFASGDNPTLFDHSVDNDPRPLSPAAAARLLVAHQAFAVGGLISRLPGEHRSAEASDLVKAAVVLVRGKSLFETLMLNLVVYNGTAGQPFAFEPDADRPAWERDEPTTFTLRKPDGYLDWLTWQNRRIQLLPDAATGAVERVVVMGGFQLPRELDPANYEAMVAYSQGQRKTRKTVQRDPIGFRPGRALWRDTGAFLLGQQRETVATQPPKVVTHGRELRKLNFIPRQARFALAAFGLATDQAKVLLWRREELPLPADYLDNPELVADLSVAIGLAEEAGTVVRASTRDLARTVLSSLNGSVDPKRLDDLVAAFGTDVAYWPRLDVPFRRFMAALPGVRGDDNGLAALEREWGDAVAGAAREAFELACAAVEGTGRGLRAAAEVRPRFLGRLFGTLAKTYPETYATAAEN